MSTHKIRKFEPRPVAPALQTPIDLSEEAVKKLSVALNALVADAFALYVKTKNFHWHVSGPHFRSYHLLLDDQSEQIEATIDELAERVRKIGGTTIRSIGHIAKLQRVKDNDEDFVMPSDMLSELLADNRGYVETLRKAHEIAERYGDLATASMIEIFIDGAEKRAWFLFETSRGEDRLGH